MNIRMHRFLPLTRVEGPGDRACLWVQGCTILCKGCAVPFTWSQNTGDLVTVDEIKTWILNGPKIEGVTFVGGEPFDQSMALAKLGRELQSSGMSVVTFTGYTLEEIYAAGREDWLDLLNVTDLLLDGPFKTELADLSRPWVGSLNQRFHFLSDRYKHLEKDICSIPNRLEIQIKKNGVILVNGMADEKVLKSITKLL